MSDLTARAQGLHVNDERRLLILTQIRAVRATKDLPVLRIGSVCGSALSVLVGLVSGMSQKVR